MATPQEKLKTALPNAKPKVLEKDKVANQEPQLQGVQAPEAPIPQAPEAQKMEVQTQEPKLF